MNYTDTGCGKLCSSFMNDFENDLKTKYQNDYNDFQLYFLQNMTSMISSEHVNLQNMTVLLLSQIQAMSIDIDRVKKLYNTVHRVSEHRLQNAVLNLTAGLKSNTVLDCGDHQNWYWTSTIICFGLVCCIVLLQLYQVIGVGFIAKCNKKKLIRKESKKQRISEEIKKDLLGSYTLIPIQENRTERFETADGKNSFKPSTRSKVSVTEDEYKHLQAVKIGEMSKSNEHEDRINHLTATCTNILNILSNPTGNKDYNDIGKE